LNSVPHSTYRFGRKRKVRLNERRQ
jgi:hypothetical protein